MYCKDRLCIDPQYRTVPYRTVPYLKPGPKPRKRFLMYRLYLQYFPNKRVVRWKEVLKHKISFTVPYQRTDPGSKPKECWVPNRIFPESNPDPFESCLFTDPESEFYPCKKRLASPESLMYVRILTLVL